MKKLSLFFAAVTFLLAPLNAQNVVPNPGFENYGTLPCSWILSSFDFSQAMQDWTMPTQGSTDVFSTLVATSCYANCFSTNSAATGNQLPHSGDIMSEVVAYGSGCGFQPDYREYLQCHLTAPLVAGNSYRMEIFVSLADYSGEMCNNIGMYFSTNPISSNACTELQVTPQILFTSIITNDTGWVSLSDTFVASAAFQYLTIGNFFDNQNTQHISQIGTYSNAMYFVDDVTVEEVLPSPVSSFSVPDSSVCQKFCIDFTDQSSNNPSSWLWQFPGGSPASSTDQNPSQICYNNPGTYDVTLITSNSFGTDTLTLINYITVYPTPPFPLISLNGLTLTSSTAATYQWQFNNVDIPGATNQSYEVTQSGFYSVYITDSNGCSSSANQDVLITGMGNILSSENISLYPNPSDGSFVLEWNNGLIKGDALIEIVNTLGKVVYSVREKNHEDHFSKEIDASSLSAGIYFLQLSSVGDSQQATHMMIHSSVIIIK